MKRSIIILFLSGILALSIFLAYQKTENQSQGRTIKELEKNDRESLSKLQINNKKIPETAMPNKKNEKIRSVRVDLSSFAVGNDHKAAIAEIIGRIKESNGNTIYLSPWSDGYANYASDLAQRNRLGQKEFFENFLDEARKNDIRVFAWFVVAKDNFPAGLRPDWYAVTADGNKYGQEDEPGLFLPFASLANDEYVNYHLGLVKEVSKLPIDGWVISEPLLGWGDIYDDYYTDFSAPAVNKFKASFGIDPNLIIDQDSPHYFEYDRPNYQAWTGFRAGLVTEFVARTMNEIRKVPARPIVITVFTEPDRNGRLKDLEELKEWLGTDIPALASLKPQYMEIQSLFDHFEYPQAPAWSADMLLQFKKQLSVDIPLLVSVQGFDSEEKLKPSDFGLALNSVIESGAAGTSFYAYHTMDSEKWAVLKKAWE